MGHHPIAEDRFLCARSFPGTYCRWLTARSRWRARWSLAPTIRRGSRLGYQPPAGGGGQGDDRQAGRSAASRPSSLRSSAAPSLDPAGSVRAGDSGPCTRRFGTPSTLDPVLPEGCDSTDECSCSAVVGGGTRPGRPRCACGAPPASRPLSSDNGSRDADTEQGADEDLAAGRTTTTPAPALGADLHPVRLATRHGGAPRRRLR